MSYTSQSPPRASRITNNTPQTKMRTHTAKGVSLPKNMTELAQKMAAAKGLKWSAYIQQLLIREIKAENAGITTEFLMGTDEPAERHPVKLTPAQRVAIAKLEMGKTKNPKKTPKRRNNERPRIAHELL